MTVPETRMNLTLVRAGEGWDAVRVTVAVGRRVMDRLGPACGSVISDGAHMWFFVEPGQGGRLMMPGVTVLGTSGYVLMPADRLTTLPGPHWTRTAFRLATSTHRLHTALTGVIG